jgi:hypothetical protein
MSGIQQMLTGGTYTPALPTTIGQAYGGGFYAGKIAVGGGGVATHYLIVAPKASGENSARTWGTMTVTTGITSAINGPTNSASLAALGAAYQAAVFCEGLTIGGYSDWYLPARNELEVLYYFLKPTTTANATTNGLGAANAPNPNAVSPEPVNTAYTDGTPAQTNATGFKTTEINALESTFYWSSTEYDLTHAWYENSITGDQWLLTKDENRYVRAVRRIPV